MTEVVDPPAVAPTLDATVRRDDLLRAVQAAYRHNTVNGRPSPLGAVRISVGVGGASVRGAADTVDTTAYLRHSASGSGEAVLPARTLTDLLSALPAGSQVRLTVRGSAVTLTAGAVRYRVPTLPLERVPPEPEGEFAPAAVLGSVALGIIARVATHADSADTAHPVLAAVEIGAHEGHLSAAATDRYRLAAWDSAVGTTLAEGESLLVPATVAADLPLAFRGTALVRMDISEPDDLPRRVRFSGGGTQITVRVIDGTYPTWRTFTEQEHPRTVTASRAALALAVEQAEVAAERNFPVRLTFTDTQTRIEAGDADGEHTPYSCVPIKSTLTGEPGTVALNPSYIRAALETLTGRTVALGIGATHGPVAFHATDGNTTGLRCVVMPVRLDETVTPNG